MKKMQEFCERLASIKTPEDLVEERWFWCDICDGVSYSYGCECYATSCNCAGCDKCCHLHKITSDALKEGKHPNEEYLKQKCLDNGGTPEKKLFDRIFGTDTQNEENRTVPNS